MAKSMESKSAKKPILVGIVIVIIVTIGIGVYVFNSLDESNFLENDVTLDSGEFSMKDEVEINVNKEKPQTFSVTVSEKMGFSEKP